MAALDGVKILVVIKPFLQLGGGTYRAFLSIQEYIRNGADVRLIVPRAELLKYSIPKEVSSQLVMGTYSLRGGVYALLAPSWMRAVLDDPLSNMFQPDLVIGLHENLDVLRVASMLGDRFNVPTLALLQLPPFYGNERRRLAVNAAYDSWAKLFGLRGRILRLLSSMRSKLFFGGVVHLVSGFTGLISVSPSIPFEMGSYIPADLFQVLDPGVGFSDDDVRLLDHVRKLPIRPDRRFILFGGRPDPGKGVLDAIIAFSKIVREYPDLRLVVTGSAPDAVLSALRQFASTLGVGKLVDFVGYVSREERLLLAHDASVVLYPSHVDSFSYATFESLYLGTPVVAYDLPALRHYYGDNSGIALVPEGNVDALVSAAVDVLRNPPNVDNLVIPKYRDIFRSELRVLREYL